MEKLCPVCNKSFRVKPSQYNKRSTCSRECMAKLYKQRLRGEANPHWRGGDIDKICKYCGKGYSVPRRDEATSKYCSYLCRDLDKRIPQVERGPKAKRDYRCIVCDKEISKGRKYCKQCSPRGNGKRVTAICSYCGKTFSFLKSSQRNGRRLFCSRFCRSRGYSQEGNPNWKGGRKQLARMIRGSPKSKDLILKVLRRDRYICQNCGQVGGKLEIDHIKPFSDILEEFLRIYSVIDRDVFRYELYLIALKYKPFWDQANLRTLCKKCNWWKELERRNLELALTLPRP